MKGKDEVCLSLVAEPPHAKTKPPAPAAANGFITPAGFMGYGAAAAAVIADVCFWQAPPALSGGRWWAVIGATRPRGEGA